RAVLQPAGVRDLDGQEQRPQNAGRRGGGPYVFPKKDVERRRRRVFFAHDLSPSGGRRGGGVVRGGGDAGEKGCGRGRRTRADGTGWPTLGRETAGGKQGTAGFPAGPQEAGGSSLPPLGPRGQTGTLRSGGPGPGRCRQSTPGTGRKRRPPPRVGF